MAGKTYQACGFVVVLGLIYITEWSTVDLVRAFLEFGPRVKHDGGLHIRSRFREQTKYVKRGSVYNKNKDSCNE